VGCEATNRKQRRSKSQVEDAGDLCAHESVPQIASASKCLRRYYEERGRPPEDVTDSAILMANYLDGIAIGIEQDLYSEALAKDHLRQIVKAHVEGIFPQNGDDLAERNNYQRIINLNNKWTRDAENGQ
jgi:hypothetical protein